MDTDLTLANLLTHGAGGVSVRGCTHADEPVRRHHAAALDCVTFESDYSTCTGYR
jgi:hypothetical protein